ncbi:hypothetical protein, partial [Aliikangiella maris]
FLILALGFSHIVVAGGWTKTASVADIEIIRGQGFQITGDFGNPSECTVGNTIYVALEHPQYDKLLSISMAAFMGNKKLRIYSHQCANYGWHGGTYNELTSDGSMYLKN